MPEKLSHIGEFGLIDRIYTLIRKEGVPSSRITLGLGDDTAAFLPRRGYELLITCDSLVENRHFLSAYTPPFDLGRRAMSQNISDIGAMGGRPLYALVSLGLKKETPLPWIEEMYRGFLRELNSFKAAIIGGNLTETSDALFIDITLIGEVLRGKWVGRSGAKPGDAILLSGYPGESAAGLTLLLKNTDHPEISAHPLVQRYLNPGHRAVLAAALAETGKVTAMIDTSDGFLGDLGHILDQSAVGAEVIKGNLPMRGILNQAASQLGKDPYDYILGNSDDYELILTCPPEHLNHIRSLAKEEHDLILTEVGRITGTGGEITLILPDGSRQLVKPTGWDHFRSDEEGSARIED
jgi:thiamine-monophosphate kinase